MQKLSASRQMLKRLSLPRALIPDAFSQGSFGLVSFSLMSVHPLEQRCATVLPKSSINTLDRDVAQVKFARHFLPNVLFCCIPKKSDNGALDRYKMLDLLKPRVSQDDIRTGNTEFATLLNRAGSQGRFDVLIWLVLGGLVGLRPYEVLRLEWTGIHFQTREIRVEPGWTKTHRARIVALQPSALEWLRLIAAHAAEKTGKVMPSASTWNNRWRRWRQEEDTPLPLGWWVGKDDVLRHSYGTYRAAILRNSHNLTEEMRNSVAIVRTYYDAVVSPSVAKLWWKIAPERPENVVRIKAIT